MKGRPIMTIDEAQALLQEQAAPQHHVILLAQEVARRDDAHHLVPDVIRLAEGVGISGRMLDELG